VVVATTTVPASFAAITLSTCLTNKGLANKGISTLPGRRDEPQRVCMMVTMVASPVRAGTGGPKEGLICRFCLFEAGSLIISSAKILGTDAS
jgi:hypothetical protein